MVKFFSHNSEAIFTQGQVVIFIAHLYPDYRREK